MYLEYNSEEIFADYCWIICGSRRKKIICAFNSEKISSEIVEATGLRFSNVSGTLRKMANRGIVEIIELPERHRLYRLTEKGELIVNKIQNSSTSLESLLAS